MKVLHQAVRFFSVNFRQHFTKLDNNVQEFFNSHRILKMYCKFNHTLGWLGLFINISCILGYVYVETKLGILKGRTMLSRNGSRFKAFMGVPYAKPPVGLLRFKDPQPVEPWNGTLDATQYPPMCPQCDGIVGYRGDEDCLYLNIYLPEIQNQGSLKLPVWVFIYGGRRIAGHVAPYKHGPHYIMDKPVIFITMTYRLGPLGFLSMEDNVIPGNFGLKDETMVLWWIKNNIQSFGGDPTNVTISGGSSGAIDVGLHISSPLSKGLFHRAISQSGTPLLTIMNPGSARKTAWNLARVVGCYNNLTRSEQLLRCLQNVPTKTLIQNWSRQKHHIFSSLPFGTVIESPNVDGRFLASNPFNEIKKSNSIPWIIGINRNEGTVGTAGIFSTPKVLKYFTQHLRNFLPLQLSYQDSPRKHSITELICQKYFHYKPLNDSFYGFAKVFSTAFFISAGIETILHYNGPKYFYLYDHENQISYVRNYFLRGVITKHKTGVTHGEELRSLQHYEMLLPPIVDGVDRIVSDQLISMWYNFVAHGDPNDKHSSKIWEPVSTADVEYLHIFNGSLVMKKRPMWDDYLFSKQLGHPFLNTLNSL